MRANTRVDKAQGELPAIWTRPVSSSQRLCASDLYSIHVDDASPGGFSPHTDESCEKAKARVGPIGIHVGLVARDASRMYMNV